MAWIGIDLDGTLARYDGWKGIEHIGEPIPLMTERVREWHRQGRDMKIFTARVSVAEPEKSAVIGFIHAWLAANGLPILEVTNVKDFGMIELWDDRAIQVQLNTGRRIGVEMGDDDLAYKLSILEGWSADGSIELDPIHKGLISRLRSILAQLPLPEQLSAAAAVQA